MSELEKQQNGEWYNSDVPEIVNLQITSRKRMKEFNAELNPEKRFSIMKKWFNSVGEKSYIEPPFFCDFGCNIQLGKNVYFNANCTVLDSAKVIIGDNTKIACNVQIITPIHPIIPEERLKTDNELAKPVIIGENCWIGAGVIIFPGVRIGDGVTIGAGSVVTKDIPPRCVAFGNPCRVQRFIE